MLAADEEEHVGFIYQQTGGVLSVLSVPKPLEHQPKYVTNDLAVSNQLFSDFPTATQILPGSFGGFVGIKFS